MIARSAEGGGPLLVHPLLVCVYSRLFYEDTFIFTSIVVESIKANSYVELYN